VRFGGYKMDLDRRKVESPEGNGVELTRTEFDLLAFFVRERERVLRRDDILDAVWGKDVVVDPHTVDNFVSSLKKKLGWNSASRFTIQTVRGVGYRMEIEAP
jgi:DNA-binding response OmpR family regulator